MFGWFTFNVGQLKEASASTHAGSNFAELESRSSSLYAIVQNSYTVNARQPSDRPGARSTYTRCGKNAPVRQRL